MIGLRFYPYFLAVFLSFASFGKAQGPIALPIPEPLDGDTEVNAIPEKALEGQSYQELEDLRATHANKIDELIKDRKLRENPRGTIDLLAILNSESMGMVKTENRIRQKMFEIIGEQENRSARSIGREFYAMRVEQLKGDNASAKKAPIPNNITPSLSIAADPSIPNQLLNQLANGLVKAVGYPNITEQKVGNTLQLVGQRSFGSGYFAVETLPAIPAGAEENSGPGIVSFESGRVAGAIPSGIIALDGLAIVVNKDNPLNELTALQVANIFSGKFDDWDFLKGRDDEPISVMLPAKGSDLEDLLNTLILNPYERNASATETTTQSSNHLDGVARMDSAISICRSTEIPDNVKALRIRSGEESIPMAPTQANIIALDYPFIGYVRIRALGERNNRYVSNFTSFAGGTSGQKIISEAGLSGITSDDEAVKKQADQQKQLLLSSREVASSYKEIIREANRHHSLGNLRFVPKTKEFLLNDYSENQLSLLVRHLIKSNDYKNVLLLGFADSQGAESTNKAYSLKRAEAMASRLKEQGITNVKSFGIGEDVPVGNNGTENGRASNRRVEVWIEPK